MIAFGNDLMLACLAAHGSPAHAEFLGTKIAPLTGGPRKFRYRGICKAAVSLGVTRVHLYLVLTGQRESKSLLDRYEQLRQAGKEHAS